MKHNKALLISFILIAVLSVAGHFFFIESNGHIRYDGYGLPFLCMVIVGLIGYVAWKKYPINWPSRVWVIVYSVAFFVLASFLLVNKFIFHLSSDNAKTAHYIRDIFNSPVPFLILYILVRKATNATPVQTKQQH